jgi:hypothetical protein
VPGSVYDPKADACLCNNAANPIEQYNGTLLVACLSAGTAACPPSHNVTTSNSGKIEACSTLGSNCPAGFIALWNGKPQLITECRNLTGCSVSGYDLEVTDSAGKFLGEFSSTAGSALPSLVKAQLQNIACVAHGNQS